LIGSEGKIISFNIEKSQEKDKLDIALNIKFLDKNS